MRLVVTLLAGAVCVNAHIAAFQGTSGGAAAGAAAPRACAVLTRDLVAPFTENKKMLDLVPPEEEVLGASGTACEHGGVRLQLFPGRGGKRTVSSQDYQSVTGAGEGGLFRSNRNRYAELMVWTSRHSLDLQVSVPAGRTAETMKTEVIALANAILAKLP
jgi:hypothetical protein